MAILQDHSIGFWILTAFMLLGVLAGWVVATLFLFRRSGLKAANFWYSALCGTFAFTSLFTILRLLEFNTHYPDSAFLPFYFTLAFPILLFYYVKFNLYPNYRLRWTDAKHFILPIGQFVFFIWLFCQPTAAKMTWDRSFYNPFYGGLEQCIYLITFFSYLYFAYRYVRHQRAKKHRPAFAKRVLYLQNFLLVLFGLFVVHSILILTDFFAYELFNINLRSSKLFAGIGVASFGALLYWLVVYGVQVLLWGRRVFDENAAMSKSIEQE